MDEAINIAISEKRWIELIFRVTAQPSAEVSPLKSSPQNPTSRNVFDRFGSLADSQASTIPAAAFERYADLFYL